MSESGLGLQHLHALIQRSGTLEIKEVMRRGMKHISICEILLSTGCREGSRLAVPVQFTSISNHRKYCQTAFKAQQLVQCPDLPKNRRRDASLQDHKMTSLMI